MTMRAEILAKIDEVEAIPSSATQAIELLQDDAGNIDEIAAIVQHDPGLTANLLRLCNSVRFGGRTKFNSVKEAAVRLGNRRILQLIMTTSVGPLIRQPLKGYDLPPGELWEHSVAVAIGTERLANALDLSTEPAAFTAALLHDVGKIVLGTFLAIDAEPITKLAFRDHVPFEKAEHHVLGIDHAEVGAVLLERWQLPANIVDTVRWHHEPERATVDRQQTDLVHVADLLAMGSGIGTGVDGINYLASPEVKERLKLKAQLLESVLCTVITELSELRELFQEPARR